METFDIVDNYFCKVCEIPEDELDPASRALVEVWHSGGLIGNGGLHDYLCAIGDKAYSIADHYRIAGLHDAASLIDLATDLWKQYWPKESPEDSDPDKFRDMFGPQLDKIEADYFKLKEEFPDKLVKIIPKSSN